jgi:hypothetical protein
MPYIVKSVSSLVVLASIASAQLGKPMPDPNFPGGGNKIDVQATSGNNGCLGCARDMTGHYWVSSRAPGSTGRHKLYKFGPNGALVATFDQLTSYAASATPGFGPWGLRDLAYDGVAHIYGGAENTSTGSIVSAFNVLTGQWDSTKDWVAPASGPTIVRCLAYDPNGDNGNGTMWTGDFGANIVEFKRDGTILRSMPSAQLVSQNQTASFYGAAYDPVRRTIWWFSQGGSSRAANLRVVGFEMDTSASGFGPTGQMFQGDVSVAGSPAGGIAGGCEFYDKNGRPTLLCLSQANSDTIYELHGRLNFGAACGGQINFKGECPWSGNSAFQMTLKRSPSTPGTAFLLLCPDSLSIPAQPPLFAPGCTIYLNLSLPVVVLGSGNIANGEASLPVPIPANIFGEVVLQWVESMPSNPLRLSDGGRLYIYL